MRDGECGREIAHSWAHPNSRTAHPVMRPLISPVKCTTMSSTTSAFRALRAFSSASMRSREVALRITRGESRRMKRQTPSRV